MSVRIEQADVQRDAPGIRALFTEYLDWANARNNVEFGVNFDIGALVEQDMATLNKFVPPLGGLLLAYSDERLAGVACMRQIGASIAEIKRMYVRPTFRGQGLGKLLVNRLIVEAGQAGYRWIRLDSARYMKEAHHLYQSLGFREIKPYAESEIPPEYQVHWIFMQRDLAVPGSPL